MNKNIVASVLAAVTIILNVYIMFKGKSEAGMTRQEQGRIKVIAGIFLILSLVALTFGEYLGLQ